MARDPETGEMLDRSDFSSEALSFLAAGSHSTAASMTFLFWHLLHRRQILNKVQEEVHRGFPLLSDEQTKAGVQLQVVAYLGLESKLPYLGAVMKESFRTTALNF